MQKTLLAFWTTVREAFRSDPLDLLAFSLLLLGIVIAPYPYGGIFFAGTFRIEFVAFLCGAATFLSPARKPRLGSAWLPVAAIAAIALLGAIQILPLPASILTKLSPVSAQVFRETSDIFTAFGRKAEAPTGRISLAPSDTAGTALMVLAQLVLFLSAFALLRTRARRRVFGVVLLLAGVFQIAYGVIDDESVERLHGSFVNPNHFAGYLQVALALAFAHLVFQLRQGNRTESWKGRIEKLVKRLVPISTSVVLWGTVAAGLALSRSRGGILAAALSTIILVVFAVAHRRAPARRRTALLVSAGLLAAGLFAASITRDAPLLRFLGSDPRDVGRDLRVEIWRTSRSAWRQFPLLGSGLGTFREAFRRVQPREVSGLVEQAHSEPLQLLVTGGVAGALLGLAALFGTLIVLARAFFLQRHREESAFVLAGLGATIALLLHGLVEFNFSLPATPATFAALLGAAWAAGRFVEARPETPFGPRVASSAVGRGPARG